jgi:hypothetical protein
MWATTEPASSLTCLVVSVLGRCRPSPASCLIFGDVIGDGGRVGFFDIVCAPEVEYLSRHSCRPIRTKDQFALSPIFTEEKPRPTGEAHQVKEVLSPQIFVERGMKAFPFARRPTAFEGPAGPDQAARSLGSDRRTTPRNVGASAVGLHWRKRQLDAVGDRPVTGHRISW